ncbi:MAG: hypothetical protein NT163_02065 [Chlorobiales bacterium]|nr:hypothetical protein [Chlorobiales bacterium]
MSNTQQLQKQNTPLKDIRISEALYASDCGIGDFMNHTDDLLTALLLSLTCEESKLHTLAMLISARFDLLKDALDKAA